MCRLEELLDRHPYDLSGGEQQRRLWQRCSCWDRKSCCWTSPPRGWTRNLSRHSLRFCRHSCDRRLPCLMVSHDIEFCARYAHRCALFFDGSIVTEAPARAFFSGNSFYTTSANRMARGLLPEAVTAEDVILACGGTLPPVPELRSQGAAPGAGGGRRVLQTKTADLVAQAGRGADRSYGLPPVPVLHEHHRFDQIDHRRRYDRAGKPSNVSVCALYSLVVPVCCLHYAPVTPEGYVLQVPRAKRKLA